MYLKEEIEKLGNTIIFLAERIEDLSKTKLLKILYILDEFSIKEFGIPFLNLKYEVWQYGPVVQEIYIELSDEPKILKDYISIERIEDKTYIKAKKGFNDDEFSPNEIDFLANVIEAVRTTPAYVLVDFTHKTDSLWYNTATKHNLLENFKLGLTNSSNIEIDFRDMLKDEPIKLNKYLHHVALDESLKHFKTSI